MMSMADWRHGGVRTLAVTLFVVAFGVIVIGVVVSALT